ncbi:cAMP-dependent protein kinase catalytic subunit alpha [Leptinotarsa decemlineata]|uniref:cAMP-dependent protein kinase catalytic subunit alpha n=1 Tax=Leptinotarsa decemlineata TaxID=7539 RepID=UPI003D30A024
MMDLAQKEANKAEFAYNEKENDKREKLKKERNHMEDKSGKLEVSFSTTITPLPASSALSKNRNRSAYGEVLERLRKEFYQRWEKKTVSGIEGMKEFVQIKTLGTGSFGRVILVKRTEGDKDAFYAMKCIEKLRIIKLKQIEHTLYEKRISESIRFPFIITLEFSFKDNSYLYFVMPFVNGGEMFTHLRRMRRFTEVLAKFYASQVILALEFLHYCDILYRDLKPENILVDLKGYLKIADLGFCKIVKGRTWTLCGTPEYIAPEIILSKGYGKAVDYWSFGVLLFEMSAGYPPFTSNDPMKVYERIITCRYKIPGTFSAELGDIIKNLLQLDLSRRYGNLRNGTQDIKNHKWFRDIDWLAIYNRQVDPPFKPAVKSPGDTSNFDVFDEEKLRISEHDLYKDDFAKF